MSRLPESIQAHYRASTTRLKSVLNAEMKRRSSITTAVLLLINPVGGRTQPRRGSTTRQRGVLVLRSYICVDRPIFHNVVRAFTVAMARRYYRRHGLSGSQLPCWSCVFIPMNIGTIHYAWITCTNHRYGGAINGGCNWGDLECSHADH